MSKTKEQLKVGDTIYRITHLSQGGYLVNEYKIIRETKTRWMLEHPDTGKELSTQLCKSDLTVYGDRFNRYTYTPEVPEHIHLAIAKKKELDEYRELERWYTDTYSRVWYLDDDMRELFMTLKAVKRRYEERKEKEGL